MTPYDPTQTQQTTQPKLPPVQLPVATGANPQIQPAPALARGIGGAMAPQGSAAESIGQAKPLATAQPSAPEQGPEAKEAARLQASKPGVQQVKNPFLRTLATVGDALASTFAPRLATVIPGTTLHHNMLLGQAEHGAAGEQTAMDNASKRALEGAQTQEALSKSNPQQKITNEFEKWMADNPNAKLDDWEKFKADHDHAVKIATPFEKWMKDNPNATVQDWLKVEAQAKPQNPTNAFELWRSQNPNASAEDWLKIESQNRPEAHSEYEDFKKAALAKNPNMPVDQIVRQFAAAHQAPQRPPESLMIVPGQNGQPGRAIAVGAGTQVPATAINVGGQSQENVKTAEQAQAETKARADAQKEYQLAERLAANPSPTNDVALLMRYIGATKPDSLGKLRLNQNEISLVMGTRSTLGDLEALEQKVVNGQKLTPKQRQDMLGSMRILAGIESGGGGGFKAGDTQVKDGVTYTRDDKGQWHPKAH